LTSFALKSFNSTSKLKFVEKLFSSLTGAWVKSTGMRICKLRNYPFLKLISPTTVGSVRRSPQTWYMFNDSRHWFEFINVDEAKLL